MIDPMLNNRKSLSIFRRMLTRNLRLKLYRSISEEKKLEFLEKIDISSRESIFLEMNMEYFLLYLKCIKNTIK